MTRQEFLAGNPFTLGPGYSKGATTYYFTPGETCTGSLCKQIRSGVDGRVILDDWHLSVEEIGIKLFKGFTFVLNKKINVNLKFEDLYLYTQ